MVTLLLAGWVAVLPAAAGPAYEDETVRFEYPDGWHVTGGEGEYFLESDGEEVASLLVLPRDANTSMSERLAEIEKQFLATGMIHTESSVSRRRDDTDVFYRRYRLVLTGSEEDHSLTMKLHQYSFWRAEAHVLLQVETAPGSDVQEPLFERIFDSLEIRESPDPFLYRVPDDY